MTAESRQAAIHGTPDMTRRKWSDRSIGALRRSMWQPYVQRSVNVCKVGIRHDPSVVVRKGSVHYTKRVCKSGPRNVPSVSGGRDRREDSIAVQTLRLRRVSDRLPRDLRRVAERFRTGSREVSEEGRPATIRAGLLGALRRSPKRDDALLYGQGCPTSNTEPTR